ncbi:MAG: aminoacyl--tRNA ligase-related protein [Patescibacteria group bacterium]
MLQSQLFTKTRREAPKDEVAKNAQLLIRAGYIDKLAAGVYTYLPLGLRVLKKIEQIIREEMNAAGGVELLMPSFHPKELWEKTGRWGTMTDLYKVADSSGREVALGPTHEEVVTPLVGSFISSYRDLPVYVYQFQNKFRMELRAKSGLLRGREFLMKDFYSFHCDEKDLAVYYEKMKEVYRRVFERIGIGEKTYLTYALGGSFSKYSHEFQMTTPAGEDTIYVCGKCRMAINKEIKAEQPNCPGCGASELREERAIEVGNIFELKTKYSNAFNLSYKDEEGKLQPVVMGCYGIGLGRVMGAVVEAFADEKGIIWPEAIAPFRVHLLNLNTDDDAVNKAALALYEELSAKSVEALYDDRSGVSAGEKFKDSDLIGVPLRIVVSEKTLAENKFEIKKRADESARMVTKAELLETL